MKTKPVKSKGFSVRIAGPELGFMQSAIQRSSMETPPLTASEIISLCVRSACLANPNKPRRDRYWSLMAFWRCDEESERVVSGLSGYLRNLLDFSAHFQSE